MEGPTFIVNLATISLSEASARVRIPLLQLGNWVKGVVSFSITSADVKAIVANFRKRGTGEIVIDYEHGSESPARASGGPIPAAGWLKAVEEQPDTKGILWGLGEFTERARRMIADREYKYLSPAIDWGTRDTRSGEQQGATLRSMALVDRPFLDALPAIQLSEAGWSHQEGGTGNVEGSIFEDIDKLDKHMGVLTKQRVAEKAIPYSRALAEISNENPALMALREALYRRRERGKCSAKTYEWIDGRLRELEENFGDLIKQAMEKNPNLTHGQAFKLVASEHPQLMSEREWLRDQ